MLHTPDIYLRPFPEYIDGTAYSDLKMCPTRFYWPNVRRIRPGTPNAHLVAGGALARGLETARLGFWGNKLEASHAETDGLQALLTAYTLDEPPPGQEKKSIDRVVAAYESYLAKYPLDWDIKPVRLASGRLGIELTFTLDIGLPLHPDTGLPLLFSGKIDLLAESPIGLTVVDEKTCSGIEKDTTHWELRSQFMGYALAATLMGFEPKWIIIRRIALLKESIQHQDVLLGVAPWKISRWLEELKFSVAQALDYHHCGLWPQALNDPCSMYGGCPYRSLCILEHPHDWEQASGFVPNTWNPLASPQPLIQLKGENAA